MRRAGSESWLFAYGIDQLPHAALYVRDATGLLPPRDPVVPPRLVQSQARYRHVLDDAGRADAGAQWLRWWRALVTGSAQAQYAASRGDLDDARSITDLSRGIWPDDQGVIAALGPGDQTALSQAVRAAFEPGSRWNSRYRPPQPETDLSLFEWHLVRDTAEDLARRHRVNPGALRGYAVVLLVHGKWRAAFDGAMACSLTCAGDPDSARAVVTEAFESSLAGR
jgi:hypothetical protein